MFAPPTLKVRAAALPVRVPETVKKRLRQASREEAKQSALSSGDFVGANWSFADLSATSSDRPAARAGVQAKLTVGASDDAFEREADRAAAQVMRMTSSESGLANDEPVSMPIKQPPRLSRKCAACDDEDQKVHAKRDNAASVGVAPAIVHQALDSAGRPLDRDTRAFFEPRFGRDFSEVRVHTDALAAASAASINARAYTLGNQIIFGAGEYQIDRLNGRSLLAHELAHVVQQSDRRAPVAVRRKPGDAASVRGFAVSRLPDGSLAISDIWQDTDDMRSFWNRCEVHYIHWRFGNVPIAIEARLLGIFADAKTTDYVHEEPTAGNRYGVKIEHSLEAQLITAAQQPSTQPPVDATPATTERSIVGAKGSAKTPDQSKAVLDAEKPTSIVASLDYLKTVDPAFSNGYLAMMENFAGLKVTPEMRTMASDRLDASEIVTIMGSDALLVDMTRRYIQAVVEFTAFKGDQYPAFSRLVETLLEQVSRGNPTAISNNLAIGKGRRNDGWGIFNRPDWVMYYDAFGQALRSVGGGAFTDPGYVGAEKISHGINVANIQDPALRGMMNMLRQSVGEPTRMVVLDTSQHLFENIEIVKAEVLNNLGAEVREKFQQMLPLFLGFIGGKATATFLERSPTPATAAIGLTLHGLLAIAGYILDIDFAAQTLSNLVNAGYHISRLRQKDDGTLTEVSQHHLAEGGAYLRKIVSDLVILAGTIGFTKLLGAMHKLGRVEIECTTCKINFGGETGAQMEKRLLRADDAAAKTGETAERLTLREPIKKGERANTLDRIAAVLQQRADLLAKEGKGADLSAKLNAPDTSAMLEGDALSFVLKDPPLAREWLRLALVKAARENISIRKSGEFQKLPQEYKAMLDLAPDAVRQIVEEIGSFEKGAVGRKRVDIVDFKLDAGEAIVTDITKWSTPWHKFKTLFYARVIKSMTGLTVDALDIGGNPLVMPEIMLDQP